MEFLNFHHLRYFWVVAKEGGLRKAAAKLHVSQPTISAQIAALENVLGEKLFRRGGRALTLTEAGQHVLAYAEEIFSIGQDLLDSIKQRPTTSRPLRVRLGVADALPKLVTYQIIQPMSNSGLRRSLEKWFHGIGIRPRLVGEIEDPAFVQILALHGLGFMSTPTVAAKEIVTRFGFGVIGRTEECRQQFYAIAPERKLTHPAVLAMTANAKALLTG